MAAISWRKRTKSRLNFSFSQSKGFGASFSVLPGDAPSRQDSLTHSLPPSPVPTPKASQTHLILEHNIETPYGNEGFAMFLASQARGPIDEKEWFAEKGMVTLISPKTVGKASTLCISRRMSGSG